MGLVSIITIYIVCVLSLYVSNCNPGSVHIIFNYSSYYINNDPDNPVLILYTMY